MCTDYDPPDVWRENARVARKTHVCGECGRTIEPGEQYNICAGLSEGRWYSGKTCRQCQAAQSWLIRICDGYLVGGVLDELGDHIGEYFSPWDDKALVVLVGRGRDKWMRNGHRMTPNQVHALVDASATRWEEAMR